MLPRTRRRSPRPALMATAVVVGVGLACAVLLLGGCRGRGHRGPIVLITFDALRADAVTAFGGPAGLTPAFDELAREASWAGPAVAPSSWTVPSMAALFTGLQPWRTGNRHGDAAALPADLQTLPEALRALGFSTSGFYSGPWLKQPYGYERGFDEFRYFREGRRVEKRLAALGSAVPGQRNAGRELVWAHVLAPHAPYVRREALLPRLAGALPPLPRKVGPLDLDPYFDPAVELPPERERIFRALYQLNVAYADSVLRRLLTALRQSGRWDDTLLVVTADHGEEFKECGQVEHGGNLCRSLIEVPLLIKLPAQWGGPALSLTDNERPGTVRVRSTLIEAAGGKPESGTAPSFFQRAAPGVLSELYLGNGVNRFSWVEGDRQLLWTSRFAAAEPDYYRVHTLDIGGRPEVPPRVSPAVLHARLDAAFAAALPLSGRGDEAPALELWQWLPPARAHGGMRSPMRAVEERAAIEAMARRLKAAWVESNGAEVRPGPRTGPSRKLTAEEEAAIRAFGYASPGGANVAASPTPTPAPTPTPSPAPR